MRRSPRKALETIGAWGSPDGGNDTRLANLPVRGDKGNVLDQSGCADDAVGRIIRITNW